MLLASLVAGSDGAEIITNPQFRELVKNIFEDFIEKCSDSCMLRCRDDLTALTRYITWDLNERSSGALRRSLPDQGDIVSVYQVAVASNEKARRGGERVEGGSGSKAAKEAVSEQEQRALVKNNNGDYRGQHANLWACDERGREAPTEAR